MVDHSWVNDELTPITAEESDRLLRERWLEWLRWKIVGAKTGQSQDEETP